MKTKRMFFILFVSHIVRHDVTNF